MTSGWAKKGPCYDCGTLTAALRCHECTLLFQAMRRMGATCKRRGEKITRKELRALATCDDIAKSQLIVDDIIKRDSVKIQARWSEAERRKRSGGATTKPWTPPMYAEPPEWSVS